MFFFFDVNIIRHIKGGGIALDLEYIQFIEDQYEELIELQESCCGISLFPLQEESKPGLISRFIGFIRKKIKVIKKFIVTMFDRAITFIRKALHIKPKKPKVVVGTIKQGPTSPRENAAKSIIDQCDKLMSKMAVSSLSVKESIKSFKEAVSYLKSLDKEYTYHLDFSKCRAETIDFKKVFATADEVRKKIMSFDLISNFDKAFKKVQDLYAVKNAFSNTLTMSFEDFQDTLTDYRDDLEDLLIKMYDAKKDENFVVDFNNLDILVWADKQERELKLLKAKLEKEMDRIEQIVDAWASKNPIKVNEKAPDYEYIAQLKKSRDLFTSSFKLVTFSVNRAIHSTTFLISPVREVIHKFYTEIFNNILKVQKEASKVMSFEAEKRTGF